MRRSTLGLLAAMLAAPLPAVAQGSASTTDPGFEVVPVDLGSIHRVRRTSDGWMVATANGVDHLAGE